MGQLEDYLRRWLTAGVIEDSTAERIRAFERERDAQRTGAGSDRPGVIEVLLYLGVAVLAVGVFALMAQNWPELESGARVAVLAVPAMICLGAGALMHTSPQAGVNRAGQMAWLVAVGLAAGTLAVFLDEFQPSGVNFEDDPSGLLIVAGATAALALGLWTLSPSHAQVLGLSGATFFLAQALGNWPDSFSAALAGMTLLGVGAAAIALTEAGLMRPKLSSQLLFGILGVAGVYQAGFADNGTVFELLGFAVGAGLVVLGVMRQTFVYVFVGVGGLFVMLVTFIFEHFEDQLGAPLALILSGAILIGAVLLLAQVRPALRQGQQA